MRRPIVRPAHSSRLTARLIAVVPFAALLYGPSPALAQLGAADSFGALSSTAVTCTGSSVIGDVGVVTGAVVNTGCAISGTVHNGGATAAAAYSDFLTAYGTIGAMPCGTTLTTLSGQTLLPGVYCVAGAATEGAR